MEQNKSLGLLSLARKGGNIVLGEEQAGAAARASRARLMLLASDAGGHTVRRAKSFVAGTAQPLLTLPYTRDELGDALGTTSCAIAAITDVQLALAFVKTLGEPEKYADLLQELDERQARGKAARRGKGPPQERPAWEIVSVSIRRWREYEFCEIPREGGRR